MDLAVDTDVLVRAQEGDERHDHCFNVLELLGNIRSSGHVIVVDYEGRIQGEYRRELDTGGLVFKYLIDIEKRGWFRYVSGRLSNRTAAGLRRLGFHDDDDVFVAVAARSSDGLLVAEESDYAPPVVAFLAQNGVRVMDCLTTRAEIDRS